APSPARPMNASSVSRNIAPPVARTSCSKSGATTAPAKLSSSARPCFPISANKRGSHFSVAGVNSLKNPWSFFMRLITFENSTRARRIGALAQNNNVVDLNSASALCLKEEKHEQAFERLANALVPPDMRALFEGGDTSLDAARHALDFVQERGGDLCGVHGEPVIYQFSEIKLKAPILPKKFFHTAGNFREHHEEAAKSGFSHPVMLWIVFFQNVDAIIGHDEPVIYLEHLTQELDYELELAVVLKKSGKHFTPEDAASHVGGYVIFNDITARDIQRREVKNRVFNLFKGTGTLFPPGPLVVAPAENPEPHK